MSKIKVNEIDKRNGSTLTLGGSGTAVTLACGATQTGFGREGSVNWQTGSIKTTTFTAVSGEGYFVDTSSGAVTANLPAGSAGAIVSFADYTRTFNNNNLTISPNGSNKIGGFAQDAKLTVAGQAATFVFVDATEGWINVQETQTSQTGTSGFIMATGGTETESGNCKIHTFTGPGTFAVSATANTGACNQVSYIVVGGGGGGGSGTPGSSWGGAGGGAGGFREDKSPTTSYTASPLEGAGAITVTATSFPITVGGGGTAGPVSATAAGAGNPSVFSTITSTGGGGGASGRWTPSVPYPSAATAAQPGGSGGGGVVNNTTQQPGGTGNTPPVSPSQGNSGGISGSPPNFSSGGGGGAGAAGTGGTGPTAGGNGGNGVATEITGSSVTRAGGGAGNGYAGCFAGTGGTGGGGSSPGVAGTVGQNGTANTGGGASGGAGACGGSAGGVGGSGVVIIRYKFQ